MKRKNYKKYITQGKKFRLDSKIDSVQIPKWIPFKFKNGFRLDSRRAAALLAFAGSQQRSNVFRVVVSFGRC